MTTDNTAAIPVGENPAETMRKAMESLGRTDAVSFSEFHKPGDPFLVALPAGRKIENLTPALHAIADRVKPFHRKGTAKLETLDSLIDWTNRFKGETSALFANPDLDRPSLTCIADYHATGPAIIDPDKGDDTARHCHHRGVYAFPLSDEWVAWNQIAGKALGKDEMGEFIEANAKDVMDPTPAILQGEESAKNADWENRLIQTARQIEGRFGQLGQLLAMSRQFQVYETSNLTVKTNRDSGEAEIQFLNEHKDAEGKPLRVPNLFIIAIPVFRGGAPYRMTVRFRYRKSGQNIGFILKPYNPEKAFESAFNEAVEAAATATDLPAFIGAPEA